jgi:hypothetical protein
VIRRRELINDRSGRAVCGWREELSAWVACVLGVLGIAATALATGCGGPPVSGPPLAVVQNDVEGHVGEKVSWMGTVRRARTTEEGTDVVVQGLAAPASADGEALAPLFVATVPGRIAHALQRGQEVTVTGTVSGQRNEDLPVVKAKLIRRGLGGGARVWPPTGRFERVPAPERY